LSYKANGTLTALVDVEADIDRTAEALAYRMAYEIHDKVRRYTPTAVRPPKVTPGAFAAERARKPGTLKDSWDIGHLRKVANVYTIDVYTEDPIAPHVEYDTKPHRIRARNASMLRFRSSKTGEVVYAAEVLHPGTTGVHMLLRACTEVQADADRLMRSVLRGTWGRSKGAR